MSTQSCACCSRVSASTSTGVWLTTFSSALWLQTSHSSGATLKSPTMIVGSLKALGPARHALDEVELLSELRVDRAVGRVAAGGDVDILEPDSAFEPHADVPRLAIVLPVVLARVLQRHPAEDRDAMVHPLPVELAMDVAVTLEQIGREDGVENLGFLEAQDVGLLLGDQALDKPGARAHRVDVPGRDLQLRSHTYPLSLPAPI